MKKLFEELKQHMHHEKELEKKIKANGKKCQTTINKIGEQLFGIKIGEKASIKPLGEECKPRTEKVIGFWWWEDNKISIRLSNLILSSNTLFTIKGKTYQGCTEKVKPSTSRNKIYPDRIHLRIK